MRLGQLRADRQVLRTQPLTPAAAVALVGPGLGLHSLPIPAGDGVVLIHGHTVPDTEALGDVHPSRAGHTVTAATAELTAQLLPVVVQPFFTRWASRRAVSSTVARSSSDRGRNWLKVFRLSSSCSMLPMPLSTTFTPGKLPTQRMAQEEGVASGSSARRGSSTSSGG